MNLIDGVIDREMHGLQINLHGHSILWILNCIQNDTQQNLKDKKFKH